MSSGERSTTSVTVSCGLNPSTWNRWHQLPICCRPSWRASRTPSGETGAAATAPRPDAETEHPRGLLGVGRDYHESLLQLQRLQTDGALAWESNVNARQSHLDIDVYAVEVMRVERARLSITRKLEVALDAVASEGFRGLDIRSPIFLLPIDDIDLNPLACLDVLKLLRMITVPRLFTLLLGDLRVAELVLNLKLSNDLAELLPGVRSIELLSLQPASIAALAGDVAANALRKLLPPTQRVQLEPLSVHEGLDFSTTRPVRRSHHAQAPGGSVAGHP